MFQIRLKEDTTIPIDLTGILPETLQGLSEGEAAARAIRIGNRVVPLGELFHVERNTTSEQTEPMLTFVFRHPVIDNLGRGMTRGTILTFGSIGRNAGLQMTGGYLGVGGSVGDGLGQGMLGGKIGVMKNAGSHVGAALPGHTKGMRGGIIYVRGNAGPHAGNRMRRGLICVGGSCGDFAATEMIAGTIIAGSLGSGSGAGMKRGTIITRQPFKPSPGFRYSCDYSPQYLRLFARSMREISSVFDCDFHHVQCFRGDLLAGGRGEIWQAVT